MERTFQQVTEAFKLKALIGSMPQATVFQAAFCFLLYNMIRVTRAYIADGQGLKMTEMVDQISTENLFYDVQRQLVAWSELLSMRTTVRILSTAWTAPQVARRLKELLHGLQSKCWRKSPSKTHKTSPTKGKNYLKGGHASVYRLIKAARDGP